MFQQEPTFQRQGQLQVGPENTTPICCPECGGEDFVATNRFRRVSKIITATPTDQILPLPGPFICMDCGAELDLRKIIEDNGEEETKTNGGIITGP